MKNEFIKEMNDLRYDLEDVRRGADSIQLKMYEKHLNVGMDDNAYLDIMCLMCLSKQMMSSYIAPAYHFNNYLDNLHIDMFWDDLKYEISEDEHISMAIREAKYIADVQSVLTSIKIGLDRLVAIFSYYYKGFSCDTTFGHINEQGKAKGFMNTVVRLSQSDSLMKLILDEYNDWISIAVRPRNIIMHYNDLQNSFQFDSEISAEIPIHVCNKTMDKNYETFSFSFITVHDYCNRWYSLFDKIWQELFSIDVLSNKSRLNNGILK